jgi:hypothetical protein
LCRRQRTGLKYVPSLTLLPRRHGGEAVPMAETMPTVAVGTDVPVPVDFLCRRLACGPGRNGFCADGPDVLPSAQDLAVGTVARSRSVISDWIYRPVMTGWRGWQGHPSSRRKKLQPPDLLPTANAHQYASSLLIL